MPMQPGQGGGLMALLQRAQQGQGGQPQGPQPAPSGEMPDDMEDPTAMEAAMAGEDMGGEMGGDEPQPDNVDDFALQYLSGGSVLPEDPTYAGSEAGLPVNAYDEPTALSGASEEPAGALDSVEAMTQGGDVSPNAARDAIRERLLLREQERRERSEFFQKKSLELNKAMSAGKLSGGY